MNAKELVLNTCQCRPVPRRPVWLMRQVGRYMPSYRKLREYVSFKELIRTPAVAAEATLSVREVCDPDALIPFSDILTVPASLGAAVSYEPKLTVKAPPLDRLASSPDENWLRPAYETLEILKRELGDQKALIGFAGAPYTLLAYMLGPGPESRAIPLSDAGTIEAALEVIAHTVACHLRRQHEAGAGVLQIFDTRAADLAPHHFKTFALKPLCTMMNELADLACPIILFTRGRNLLEHDDRLPGTILSVDWTIPLDAIPEPSTRAVQGNLDPAVLFAGPEVTRRETERMLAQGAALGGHIANLGHGVLPQTPVESVQAFVATVQKYKTPQSKR